MKDRIILEDGDQRILEVDCYLRGMEEQISITLNATDDSGLEIHIRENKTHRTRLYMWNWGYLTRIRIGNDTLEDIIRERLAKLIRDKIQKNSERLAQLIWDALDIKDE